MKTIAQETREKIANTLRGRHLPDAHRKAIGLSLVGHEISQATRSLIAEAQRGEKGNAFKHGMRNTPTWRSWHAMLQRCRDPKSNRYAYYGGRGITVCDAWKTSFLAFLSDMGLRPEGMTLDRIDGDGNYEPSNCRWATPSSQAFNRRRKVVASAI